MEYGPPLSELVREYIAELDAGDVAEPLTAEGLTTATVYHRIVAEIVNSREGGPRRFQSGEVNEFLRRLERDDPAFVDDALDDCFTRQYVEMVPDCVRRMQKLSALELGVLPSQVTRAYVLEAIRTYVGGFPQASIALCRAAVEQALKEEMGYQATHTVVEMNNLFDEAETAGIIDKTVRRMARELANDADGVLHERPADEGKALEVLVKLRGVLRHIYKKEGGWQS